MKRSPDAENQGDFYTWIKERGGEQNCLLNKGEEVVPEWEEEAMKGRPRFKNEERNGGKRTKTIRQRGGVVNKWLWFQRRCSRQDTNGLLIGTPEGERRLSHSSHLHLTFTSLVQNPSYFTSFHYLPYLTFVPLFYLLHLCSLQ